MRIKRPEPRGVGARVDGGALFVRRREPSLLEELVTLDFPRRRRLPYSWGVTARRTRGAVLLLLLGCGRVSLDAELLPSEASESPDATVELPPARADAGADFDASSVVDVDARSPDGSGGHPDGAVGDAGDPTDAEVAMDADATLDADAGPASVPFATHRIAIDAHTCFVTDAGGVSCWGNNQWGQLGDGTLENRDAPAPVKGLPSAVVSVASELTSTCAVLASGSLMCWGMLPLDVDAEFPWTKATTPVDMTDGLDVRAAMVLYNSWALYALTSAGDVYVRGMPLGEPPTLSWRKVVGLPPAVALATRRPCAVTESGELWCWGIGLSDEGPNHADQTPKRMPGISGAVRVSGDRQLCVADQAGQLTCMGDFTQEPDGGFTWQRQPHPSSVPSPVGAFAVTENFGCFRDGTNTVQCRGSDQGAMGDGLLAESYPRGGPAFPVGLPSQVDELAVTSGTACARSGGSLWCWGQGPVGHDVRVNMREAQTVPGLSGVTELVTGNGFACARGAGPDLLCWGHSEDLGLPKDAFLTPKALPLPTALSHFAVAEDTLCALDSLGKPWCWGSNVFGQVGVGEAAGQFVASPAQHAAQGFDRLALGDYHGCGFQGPLATCWGRRTEALAVPTDRTLPKVIDWTPTRRASLDGFQNVRFGRYSGCRIGADNGVYCFGELPLATGLETPTKVVGTEGTAQLALGTAHACALSTTGTVRCWGDLTGTSSAVPVGMSDAVTIDAFGGITCAAKSNGRVWCWVLGESGPVEWPGFNAATLRAGGPGVCAIAKDGTVQCAGWDFYGSIGTGARWRYPHKVPL